MTSRLEPVSRVRLTSLAGDFASCTERSRGPVRRLGNMFETKQRTAPLGAHGLSFLAALDMVGTEYRFDAGTRR